MELRRQSGSLYQKMELPHDTNGDLDWNTLGNLLTANILGEVLHARFVDYKYGSITRGMHSVDTSWQFSHEEDGIMVLRKVYSNSPLHAFMGRGVIELPMEEVARFIKNIVHREQWDKHLVNIEILKEITSEDFLVRMHHRARKCLIRAERDFVYYERACHVDERFVMTALSVEHPDYPKRRGLTRAQILPGSGWVLEPYEGSRSSTLVSYLAHVDPVGVPPIVVHIILQNQVMAVHFIRDILTPPSPAHTSRPSKSRRTVWLPWQRKRVATTALQQSEDEPSTEQWERESGGDAVSSGMHFEDPVSVYAFTQTTTQLRRMESVPWDVHHHWSGDQHSHTHMEAREMNVETGTRVRSHSEGDPASLHSISLLQQNQQVLDKPEDKGQKHSISLLQQNQQVLDKPEDKGQNKT